MCNNRYMERARMVRECEKGRRLDELAVENPPEEKVAVL